MACCAAPASNKRKPRHAPPQPEQHTEEPETEEEGPETDPEAVAQEAAAREQQAAVKRAAVKARAESSAAALVAAQSEERAQREEEEEARRKGKEAEEERLRVKLASQARRESAAQAVAAAAARDKQQQRARRLAAPSSSLGSEASNTSPPLALATQRTVTQRPHMPARKAGAKPTFRADAEEWSPLRTPEGRGVIPTARRPTAATAAYEDDEDALTPRQGHRHARKPATRARQKDPTHPENYKACPTEWWSPGVDENDENGRLKDALQRASLAAGDPKRTLAQLLAQEAGAELEEGLRGLSLEKLQARARAAGISAADLMRAMASDDPQGALLAYLRAKAIVDTEAELGMLSVNELGERCLNLSAEGKARLEAASRQSEELIGDDPNGALISLIVEQSGLNQRFVLMRMQQAELNAKAREAGGSEAAIEAALGAEESKNALIKLIIALDMELRRGELKGKSVPELEVAGVYVGLNAQELAAALHDNPNPKAALIAMAIQRAKSADGAAYVNIENDALEVSDSPANAKALPPRPRRKGASSLKAVGAVSAMMRMARH